MAMAIDQQALAGAGFADADIARLAELDPTSTLAAAPELGGATQAATAFFSTAETLIGRLPPRPSRSSREQAAAETLRTRLRSARLLFLRSCVSPLYARLTDDLRRFVRVEDLVFAAADEVPGLVPTRAQISAERSRPQMDKEGHEIDQGFFLSQVLSQPLCGQHLVHAMLRPRRESVELLSDFRRLGRLDLGSTTVERQGAVGYVYHGNPGFLNAEDDSTTSTLEIATDLILLDQTIEVGALRGKIVEHPKYAGRRVFNAGINLTDLYWGQISFVDFFIARDMGFVHKMYRGLSGDALHVDEIENSEHEKPWIAAVETFAIGGGCQLLLAMDHVVAEASSYFSLPARKEGIIPGVSNMRLWRFVGDRAARQAILFERQFAATSPAGQLICDTVVPDGHMDAAIAQTVQGLTGSGVVSAAANRKAMRIGQESIDQFRQYMALYCREQAVCHYSPQLIRNLEQNWKAHQRASRSTAGR